MYDVYCPPQDCTIFYIKYVILTIGYRKVCRPGYNRGVGRPGYNREVGRLGYNREVGRPGYNREVGWPGYNREAGGPAWDIQAVQQVISSSLVVKFIANFNRQSQVVFSLYFHEPQARYLGRISTLPQVRYLGRIRGALKCNTSTKKR